MTHDKSTDLASRLRKSVAAHALPGDLNHVLDVPEATDTITALIAENERMRQSLVRIAHTFTENSHGDMSCLPASEYQRMARAALRKEGEA